MNCILELRYEELNVKKIIALMQLRKESLKKIQTRTEFEFWPRRYHCRPLTNCATKLTKRGSFASHELTKAPYIGRNSGIDCKAIWFSRCFRNSRLDLDLSTSRAQNFSQEQSASYKFFMFSVAKWARPEPETRSVGLWESLVLIKLTRLCMGDRQSV